MQRTKITQLQTLRIERYILDRTIICDLFGADLRRRVKDAGFLLSEFTAVEPYVARHGLCRGEEVFIATRPKSL